MKFQVIVGNIGQVYIGKNKQIAKKDYADYVKFSKDRYGRASGEDVTLFEDGEPIREYYGTNSND